MIDQPESTPVKKDIRGLPKYFEKAKTLSSERIHQLKEKYRKMVEADRARRKEDPRGLPKVGWGRKYDNRFGVTPEMMQQRVMDIPDEDIQRSSKSIVWK